MVLSGCGNWHCNFFSSYWAILDLIGKTEYRWIAGFKRSTQHLSIWLYWYWYHCPGGIGIGTSIGMNLSLISVMISVTVWYQYGTNIPILITDTWLFASISVWYQNEVTYQDWYPYWYRYCYAFELFIAVPDVHFMFLVPTFYQRFLNSEAEKEFSSKTSMPPTGTRSFRGPQSLGN